MRVPDILCPVLFYCDKFTVVKLSTVEKSVDNLFAFIFYRAFCHRGIIYSVLFVTLNVLFVTVIKNLPLIIIYNLYMLFF